MLNGGMSHGGGPGGPSGFGDPGGAFGGPHGPGGFGGPHGFEGFGGPGFGPCGSPMAGAHRPEGGRGYHGDPSGTASSGNDYLDSGDDLEDFEGYEESEDDATIPEDYDDRERSEDASDPEDPDDDFGDYGRDDSDDENEDEAPQEDEPTSHSSPASSGNTTVAIAMAMGTLGALFAGSALFTSTLATRSLGYLNYAVAAIPLVSMFFGILQDLFGAQAAKRICNQTTKVTLYAAGVNWIIRSINIHMSATTGSTDYGATFMLYVRTLIGLALALSIAFRIKAALFSFFKSQIGPQHTLCRFIGSTLLSAPFLWSILISAAFLGRVDTTALLLQIIVTTVIAIVVELLLQPITMFINRSMRRKLAE